MTKILMTGITGFIGNELKQHLDGKIYGLVRWSHKKEKTEGFTPVFGDLRNYNDIVQVIKDIKPEVIINLGAITPVSLSFERPFDYFDINTTGVINLVEANRRFNPYLEKFIQASTPEVYGINELPLTPETPLYPNSPYAVSKAAADLYLLYAYRSYYFPVVLSRHANCYGRKDQTHFVIESIVTQMADNKEEMCLGAPEPKRDFLYIDDVVDFYLKLLKNGKPGKIYTGGWNESYSIKEIVEYAKEITGFNGKIIWNTLPKRPGEIPEMRIDYSLAKKELDWIPKVPIKMGLKKIYEQWYVW